VAGTSSDRTGRRRSRRHGTPSPRSTPRCSSSCRFHLAETIDEWSRTPVPPGIGELAAARSGAVFALDGSAYFSRPGPRVIDGVEMLAEIMDPEAFVDIAPAGGWAPVEAG
jgi:iron complex transport system substrate-binding protein